MSATLFFLLGFAITSIYFFLFYTPVTAKHPAFREGEIQVYRPIKTNKKVNKRLLLQTWNA